MMSTDGETARLVADLARVSALLDEERAYFRSELARGARELASRDELVERLQVRGDDLAARCDELIVRRGRLREQRDRQAARRARVAAQRDHVRRELARYETSRVLRLTARVVWRMQRLRERA